MRHNSMQYQFWTQRLKESKTLVLVSVKAMTLLFQHYALSA